ncbi:MAG: type I methionyl aminopeptidase [Xanthomonadales bacterium]|nr:type I methionyl aminopeptidase [Xanthomonadales bacterium]
MTIVLKSQADIDKMRIAGRLTGEALRMISEHVQAGITTAELDDICHRYITDIQDAIPAPLNYRGFPKSICTSLNDVVCHGIPNDKKLKNGDIINIDITVIKDGWHGDSSKMFFVGNPAIRAQRLVEVAHDSMVLGIEMIKPGENLRNIGKAIQDYAESHHFSVVREYCGHGIGEVFHEAPQVLHYDSPQNNVILKPGMVFTIEPMINAGKRHTRLMNDEWTVKTRDRSLSAQWEHTIAVTDTGFEVLTCLPGDAL